MPMLVDSLRGVPKAALRTVLGNEIGKRAWKAATATSRTAPGEPGVSDQEIVTALLAHLSRRAGAKLQRERRRALVVSLCLQRADGSLLSGRTRMARATDDWIEILVEAENLYERLIAECAGEPAAFAASVRRLQFDVTVTLPEIASSLMPKWRWRTQSAAGLA